MYTKDFLLNYGQFAAQALRDRFFKHRDIQPLIEQLPAEFEVTIAGHSFEGRALHLIQWGNGPVKVFLWSQMHGDEATGTMALFDLFNYLQQDNATVQLIRANCTLYLLPMVNPDGAERFIRRNAQQIDINRDFNLTVTAEARILKALRASIHPHFGFNLHDQSTLWSVTGTGKPATLSYLAPAFEETLQINDTRKKAMLVIADLFQTMNGFLPGQIGLFNDEYEPRAFGDNFQKAGTSTILIEGGGLLHDGEKQEIRKYFFLSILSGLRAIASKSYEQQELENYFRIPGNGKDIFHLIIRNVHVNGITTSVGINYEELAEDGKTPQKQYTIADIGDLSHSEAYHTFCVPGQHITAPITVNAPASFSLFKDKEIILAFEQGIVKSKF